MGLPHIPPVDAELALAEVRARREQVVSANLLPSWFWPSLGGLMLLFVAAVESRQPFVIAAGSVVFGVGLATSIVQVVRHIRVQVRPQLLGFRGGLAIASFALILDGVGAGAGLGLQAAGVAWPATLACIPVAAGLAIGGPILMSRLRRLMLSRPLADGR